MTNGTGTGNARARRDALDGLRGTVHPLGTPDATDAARARHAAIADATRAARTNPNINLPEVAYADDFGCPVRKQGTVWLVTVDDPHVRGFVSGVYGFRPVACRVSHADGYTPEAGFRTYLERPVHGTDTVDGCRVTNPDGSWVCTYTVREVTVQNA